MLISKVSEGEGRGDGRNAGEYQTADELFELMTKEHGYDTSDDQSLSARDLIILYKNIDAGTKLMSNANIQHRTTPNQHVETIVYKDEKESDDSDVSENYSNDDLQDIFTINNERIDLINNISAIQHPLCHKIGNVGIQASDVNFEYDSHFLFKDPYIKQQLKNINMLADCTGFETMLPASLLDYICCKRLEDNYNFYMDNVIRYVQHTIDQLKRISNGDYLTDRAKEKWREVAKDLVIPSSDTNKVLATSVSIPIHVMGKVDGHRSTWDDIVHSEVDVRSLSKILEKKIIIEVPKLICGSYRLFSERSADNLIISCKKNMHPDADRDKGESRVDVVFQLKPSGSGHVISNINSIMILQKMTAITTQETSGEQHKEIAFDNKNENIGEHPKIIEIDELKPVIVNYVVETNSLEIKKSTTDTSDCSLANNHFLTSTNSNVVDKGLLNRKLCMKTETDITLFSPDELRCAIRKLNMQTPVQEESEESSTSKRKSPTRVRIKSPYENKSFTIEEKKRKKLLAIREKREKKKMALTENCKITKHKYGKGTVMAQPSNSVTKLSITNKSFYNSIYGENGNHEGDILKKCRKSQKKDTFEQYSRNVECEKGFLNSSFAGLDESYFDDGTTETIMQIQQKLDTEAYSTTVPAISNYNTGVNVLSQLIGSSCTDCSTDNDSSLVRNPTVEQHEDGMVEVRKGINDIEDVAPCQSACILVSVNSSKDKNLSGKSQDRSKKTTTPVECRKSIDKIYDLLRKLGKHNDNESMHSPMHCVSNYTENLNTDGQRSSTIQVSDSGTSVKHHIISSNPSTFSLDRNSNLNKRTYKENKKVEAPPSVVPKVIISTKLQTSKVDAEGNKTDRKCVVTSPSTKASDNPLKAISQLLHEFNNVQKTRHKSHKKVDHVFADGKPLSRQGSSKKPRHEQSIKDAASTPLKNVSYRERSRPSQPSDPAQLSHQIIQHTSRVGRKHLSDIIDEAKEARGEAVRGPSKPYSRLNTLAQPKKLYVQAQNNEYQNKYGRQVTANRLQRTTPSAPLVEKNTVNINYARIKRKGPDTASVSSAKPGISAVPPLERIMRPRRTASNSPARKRVPVQTTEPSFKQINAPKTPDLKKKMVAVESYVKSHYGHKPIDTGELKGCKVQKSRVPLVPHDIELASLTSSPIAEESTALGNKLHYMVDTMINTNAPVLSILTECKESTSKLSDGLEKLSTESLLKIDEPKSESDYPVDIFEDKSIMTAVCSIPKDKIQEDKVIDESIDAIDTYDVQPFNSATELRKLENALYQQMSVGTFPKRLRIKNLTLTPKQSLQQVIVVQSGDAGSVLVKSSLSQSLRSDSKSDSLTALKSIAALSYTHINWGSSNIPLQVATIGYAFPTFNSTQRKTVSPCVQTSENPSNEHVSRDGCKSNKTSQCFKGVHKESCLEQATQANLIISISSKCNDSMDNCKEQKEKIKEQMEITNNCEKILIISKCERIQSVTEICKKEETVTEKYRGLKPMIKKGERTENSESVQHITEQHETTETISKKIDKTNDITTSSNMSINNGKAIIESEPVKMASETIDHSTSLDILMGLLNEIRKITGETINKNTDNEHSSQCKELEIILNNAATHESSTDDICRGLVSMSSIDRLNQLDSNPSICSFNILKHGGPLVKNNENNGIIEIVKDSPNDSIQAKYIDKEVTVDFEKQYVNKLTDAPSCYFPLTTNSTNISDSIINICNEPSTQSVYSFAKYETLNSNTSYEDDNIENAKVKFNKDKSPLPAQCSIYNEIEDLKILRELSATIKIETAANMTSSYKCATSACVMIGAEYDAVMKIKRDVLVTVYSILVFIVFAALSFPKVFFHVEM